MRSLEVATLAVAAAASCDNSTFPRSYADLVFTGLHRKDADSAAACQQACCDEGDACAVWQWADQAPASPVGSCWVGPKGLPHKPQNGWVSFGVDGLAPVPTPPAPTPPTPSPPASYPKPSEAQLRWMEDEKGAIGHFNMGTFQACGIGLEHMEGPLAASTSVGLGVPPPETFAPTNVDTEAWVKGLKSVGITRAVLVVSHGCGFNTFPSETKFPEFGFEYNYSVAQSPWKNGTGDIAAEFVASCRKHGIRPGFYHGAQNNAFLNVVHGRVRDGRACSFCPDITQDQYEQVLLANLRQLWTRYGELAEVWFDAGLPAGFSEGIAALLAEVQPSAVAFQGPGPNGIRWGGTESGHVKYPFWSTVNGVMEKGAGTPDGSLFRPAEADTCFQGGKRDDGLGGPYGGCWFYNAGMVPKSLTELVSHYHDSVGRNAFMLLDWTPTKEGTMREDHLQRYQEFGDWLRSCYDAPVATVSAPEGSRATLEIPAGAEIDRVVIEEDQTDGERIRSYSVAVDGVEVASGESVGNKRIHLFNASAVKGRQLVLEVTGDAPRLARVSAHNCSRSPAPQGCNYLSDFRYKTVDEITIKTVQHSSAEACCAACRADTECAVFVLDAEKLCTLLSANQGGDAEKGTLSGSPALGSRASPVLV